MYLRRYLSSDHDAMWVLHNEALESTGARADDVPWDDDLHEIDDVYLSGEGEFLVGLRDNKLIAMGALVKTDPARGEIKRMRVHPNHQRKGYGKALLRALEARANELGFTDLHLTTTVQQMAARSLYQKLGYRETGRGTYCSYDVVLYEKHL